MTNSQTLGTIKATNPVLAVAPLKEETEKLRLSSEEAIRGHRKRLAQAKSD